MMTKQVVTISTAILLAAIAGCATVPAEKPVSMRGYGINAANDSFGLVAKEYVGKRPGMQPIVARTFSTQPPVIPHATDNFDEITLEENQCMSCHSVEKYKEKKSPKVGDSHFINPATGKKLASISASRHNCVQCHVPQVDAPPLVENTFVGNVKNP